MADLTGPDLTDDTTRDALEAPALRARVAELEIPPCRTRCGTDHAAARDLAVLNRHERG